MRSQPLINCDGKYVSNCSKFFNFIVLLLHIGTVQSMPIMQNQIGLYRYYVGILMLFLRHNSSYMDTSLPLCAAFKQSDAPNSQKSVTTFRF